MGFMYLMQNFQTERLIAAVGGVAGSFLTLEQTHRSTGAIAKAFGKPIIKREVLAAQVRRPATPSSRRRKALTYKCVEEYNDEHYVKKQPLSMETVKLISMAKIFVGDLVSEVADQCLQFHGGWGYIEEFPIARDLARPAALPHRRRHDRDDALLPRQADGALAHSGGPSGTGRSPRLVPVDFTRQVKRPAVEEPSLKFGAVAQLGERLTGSQKVMGSIPFSSTVNRDRHPGEWAQPVPKPSPSTAGHAGAVEAPADPGGPTAAPLASVPADTPQGSTADPPKPRAALAATLAGHMASLLASGDVEGARVAGDAMMRLLGSDAGQGSPVVDLAAEREKRGR